MLRLVESSSSRNIFPAEEARRCGSITKFLKNIQSLGFYLEKPGESLVLGLPLLLLLPLGGVEDDVLDSRSCRGL